MRILGNKIGYKYIIIIGLFCTRGLGMKKKVLVFTMIFVFVLGGFSSEVFAITKEEGRTLNELGYYKKEFRDESLNTRGAILRFQSSHNLIVDGIFGENSRKAFEKELEKGEKGVDIIKSPPTKGRWIAINKTNRTLTLYEGKEVLKKYPIAQGKKPNYTPEGKFKVANKIVKPAWGGAGYAKPVKGGAPNNPLGSRWLGISYKGGGKYGIHGNNSPKSIGTNASLGCIRMFNSDVEELFNEVKVGIPVWIGTDAKLKSWGVNQTQGVQELASK